MPTKVHISTFNIANISVFLTITNMFNNNSALSIIFVFSFHITLHIIHTCSAQCSSQTLLLYHWLNAIVMFRKHLNQIITYIYKRLCNCYAQCCSRLQVHHLCILLLIFILRQHIVRLTLTYIKIYP